MSKVTKESKVLAALQANTAKGITAAQMTSRFGVANPTATVTALRTKHARSLRICVLLKSICFLRIVSWVRMERKLLQEWHLM